MYDSQGRHINVHDIELQTNPKDSGNIKVGVKMTIFYHGLVAEDAVCFNQPLCYSVKTNERAVLLRCPYEKACNWPEEIQNNLKMNTLDKYRVFLNQVQALQEKLNTADNKYILEMESKMQKRVRKNYPVGNIIIQSHFKAKSLKRINNFKPQFIVNKDERYAKFSKPLYGYVTKEDNEKLDRIGRLFVKPLTRAQAEKRTMNIRTKLLEAQKKLCVEDETSFHATF